MERKFKNNPDFEKQYKEFMNEYESLGHMSLVNSRSHTSKDQNFLPHHAVIKPSSLTTKLRVVFDASCKTTNGTSLNSLLGVGPKLQRDIFEILLNFRIPRIVFTADIEKMYRQILVADEDQKYQQILWRNNSSENIRTNKLKTVTYGLASASFWPLGVLSKSLSMIKIIPTSPEFYRKIFIWMIYYQEQIRQITQSPFARTLLMF
ncbi:uncharacterized protein TNCV_98701 [Trichonephila clavipes]|nr:uncharacterized protein TNCV_98701 [Trichonephila clavipes]